MGLADGELTGPSRPDFQRRSASGCFFSS